MSHQPLQSTIAAEFPASFAQQRLWFVDTMEPGNWAYNVPIRLDLRGPLDVDAIGHALNHLVERHEILRTTFRPGDGTPIQVISTHSHLDLVIVDAADETGQRRIECEQAREIFDLANGPLFRACLMRISPTHHRLLLTLHHIVFDGWSVGVLLNELAAAYNALTQGRAIASEPLSIQYADFAVWQREWMQGENLERELAWWREQLSTPLPMLALPADHARPPAQSFSGATVEKTLTRSLTTAVKELSRREGATLYMTLLAAFQLLLHRYTGQDDIVLGSPVANRNRNELEGLIGFFVNTLVLRTDLSGRPSFRELLRRVREVTLNAYAHQDVPFEKIVEDLRPERRLSQTPLFHVLFALRNAPDECPLFHGLEATLAPVASDAAKFDITFEFTEGEQITVSLNYSTDLFDAPTVERMVRHWECLLEAAAANPALPIDELPMLSDAELEALLVDCNRTSTDYPRDCTLAALFEEQALRAPDSIAVEFGPVALTYSELNARANQLAHYLRARGVRPESPVAVCVERCADMVVAVLGVVKAGGAYVPLDAGYPARRLQFMLADSEAQLVLTQAHLADRIPAGPLTALCLDRDWPEVAACPDTNPPIEATPENLAYVMYTSGSTGEPKGVAVPQRAIVRLVKRTDYAQLRSDDVIAQASNFSFDAATFEIWGALLNGGRLVGMSKDVVLSPSEFAAQLERDGITAMFLTTALFNELARHQPGCFRNMRHLLFGGEAVDVRWVQAVLSQGAPQRLLHVYGPTECTTFATWHLIEHVPEGSATIPIGQPIANTCAYVLDHYSRPVPVGVPGELYLGGDGLARGYWRRPELTAERFVANPCGESRLYRTGDLVRRVESGAIEFLGRIDHQVKIRGFRVEPGEVESLLVRHDAVRNAAVMVREDTPGEKRMVAYVVANGAENGFRVQLRAYLAEQLPAYMMPAAFVLLPALPLNQNGKVDRAALPVPDHSQMTEQEYAPPSTPVEELLAGIWMDLLKASRIGVHENFFELGGHSLLATQLVSRIRAVFGLDVPLRSVFETPTISRLASAIEALQGGTRSHVAIGPRPSNLAPPASFAQQRLWFLDAMEPGNWAYNVPLRLDLRGALNVAALRSALNSLVERHEILRTTFRAGDGAPIQETSAAAELDLTIIDTAGEAHVLRIEREQARTSFDLATGPLFCACLLRINPIHHRLLLTFHHIIFDGWSIGVLLNELAAAYTDLTQGRAISEQPPAIQYADFTAWQREWMKGEKLERELDWWRRQLTPSPSILTLPADHPRTPVQTFAGAAIEWKLSPPLTSAVKELSRREGATVYMTLLAAFQVLLHRYTGQDDIVLGSPVANRNCTELEGLIGFFVNTLVLRTDMSGRPSYRELLRRVREVTLDAYAHQDVPFEKIVEDIRPERRLSHTPLFQVMFALRDTPTKCIPWNDIEADLLPTPIETAKLDLTLEVTDSDVIEASLNYNTDLFEPATVERMLSHWEHLLTAAVAQPDRPIADLPLLNDTEHRQILVDWNNTATEYPRAQTVVELVEYQAATAPDALAVQCGTQSLSYAELNARANRLAHHLRAHGIQPESLVGVCLERSLDLVVAVLAVLKSGGAYVALDAGYPAKRLEFMLADAQAQLVLTHEHLLDRLTVSTTPAFCLDRDWPLLDSLPDTNPDLILAPGNLAYLIYTSGSTGQPKGVAIEHHGLMNLVQWHQREYQLTPEDRATQLAGTGFDASVWEIWPYLTAGASLHIPDEETRAAPPLLLDWLRAQRITLTFLPTPLAEALLELPGAASLPLRALLTGGDRLHRSWPNLHFRLMNHYGPTENSVVATWCEVHGDHAGPPPIGKPLDNVRVYVLDTNGQPLPVGVPGELHIAGESLARGYWRQPELTSERFVDGASVNEQRLYRTGDRVHWRPDGQLDFEGRIDQQVKLRGFRVEPGEIEAAMVAHELVREAVVVLRADLPGPPRLVGYVVPSLDPEAITRLRQFLSERLPDYMIPSPIIGLDSFPLTASGKVDRSALPVPEARTTPVAPSTDTQHAIQSTWARFLQRDDIGIDDNFFDAGGHSLLAAQVFSDLRNQFGTRISLLDLFRHPTIRALADVLEGKAPSTRPRVAANESRSSRQRRALQQMLSSAYRRKEDVPADAGTI